MASWAGSNFHKCVVIRFLNCKEIHYPPDLALQKEQLLLQVGDYHPQKFFSQQSQSCTVLLMYVYWEVGGDLKVRYLGSRFLAKE